MPKPIHVKPKKFKMKSVIFGNGSFSVVIGDWRDIGSVLAMCWNGDDEGDAGYPKTFGYPMWFIVHNDLKQGIIHSLMNNDSEIINKILKNT